MVKQLTPEQLAKIEPKFKIGQRLKLKHQLNNQLVRNTVLYVTGIDRESASYFVSKNPYMNGGHAIEYEILEVSAIIFKYLN